MFITGINWGVKVRPSSAYNRSIANILVARGKESSSIAVDSLKEEALYPRWVPASDRLHVYSNSRPFSGYEKSVSMLSNSQSCIETIDKLVGKAWSMFTSKAYMHQYNRHGLIHDDFLDCFNLMEKVIFDYKSLGSSDSF